jgi:hypothetical protein
LYDWTSLRKNSAGTGEGNTSSDCSFKKFPAIGAEYVLYSHFYFLFLLLEGEKQYYCMETWNKGNKTRDQSPCGNTSAGISHPDNAVRPGTGESFPVP